jgi:hypothetical protein
LSPKIRWTTSLRTYSLSSECPRCSPQPDDDAEPGGIEGLARVGEGDLDLVREVGRGDETVRAGAVLAANATHADTTAMATDPKMTAVACGT